MNNISFIVCPNGYGHFKRVLNVVSKLLNSNIEYKINIFCKESAILKSINWFEPSTIVNNSNVEFYSTLMTNAPELYKGETFDSYKKWSTDLSLNKILNSSDLIVSDNFATPLFHFENVVLMGSFLWHDVLSQTSDKEIAAIVNSEREIVKQKRPTMICLKDMAMNEVVSETAPVFMPWFCERTLPQNKTQNTFQILITSGGTEENDKKILELISILIKLNKYTIYTDSKLFKKIAELDINGVIFSYSDEAFAKLDMIICRPGIGILTDAIKFTIPILCYGETTNKEIVHNSNRVEELGIGIKLSDKTVDEIPNAIEALYKSNHLQTSRNNLFKLETNGSEMAANYLTSLL